MLSRTTTLLSRRIALRSTAAGATRMMSDSPGSVAKSREFSKKEKAHEDQYARQKELEEIRKLRDQLKQVQEQVETLEKKKNDTNTSEKK